MQASAVTDQYTFLEVVGKGCFSRVWKARDNTTGRTVAIKEVSRHSTSWKRVSKELKFGKRLSGHPNICTMHSSVYRTKSAYLLVQDFGGGGDLCSAVLSRKKLKENVCKRYFREICSAVEHVHNNNLVHLDIKPDNILLKDPEGSSVFLVDFGLTERAGKKLSQASGTVPYMAPEAFDIDGMPAKGLIVKPSLDMWSLGVLLYSMLTGDYPWLQAVLTDPDFSEFCHWQVAIGAILSPPQDWQHFAPQLHKLLRTLFAVNPRCRCKVQDLYHYFDEKWLI